MNGTLGNLTCAPSTRSRISRHTVTAQARRGTPRLYTRRNPARATRRVELAFVYGPVRHPASPARAQYRRLAFLRSSPSRPDCLPRSWAAGWAHGHAALVLPDSCQRRGRQAGSQDRVGTLGFLARYEETVCRMAGIV